MNFSETPDLTITRKAEIVGTFLSGEREKQQVVSSIIQELNGKFVKFLDYNMISDITVMLQEISVRQDIDIVLCFNEEFQLLATNSFVSFPTDITLYQPLIEPAADNDGLYALPVSVIRDFKLNIHENYSSSSALALKSTIALIDDVGDPSGYVVLLKLLSCKTTWIDKLRDLLVTDFVFFDNKKDVLLSSFLRHDIPYPQDQHIEAFGGSYFSRTTNIYDSDQRFLGELVIMKDESDYSIGLKRELFKIILPFILALVLFIASIEDTTKRRQAEAELAEYQQHLRIPLISATYSTRSRPPIPEDLGQFVGAKRRC